MVRRVGSGMYGSGMCSMVVVVVCTYVYGMYVP